MVQYLLESWAKIWVCKAVFVCVSIDESVEAEARSRIYCQKSRNEEREVIRCGTSTL